MRISLPARRRLRLLLSFTVWSGSALSALWLYHHGGDGPVVKNRAAQQANMTPAQLRRLLALDSINEKENQCQTLPPGTDSSSTTNAVAIVGSLRVQPSSCP